jgi:putative hydrolase of the HAD superfamily
MAPRIASVIFDFGGVLTLPQDPVGAAEMAGLCRLSEEAFRAAYGRDRLLLDRGTLSSAGYWTGILGIAGVAAVPSLVERLTELDRGSWLRINPRTLAWSRELRAAGRRTAILSNMPPAILLAMRKGLPWLSEFDPALFSCDVGLVKPEPAFYELCLSRLGVPASGCVFLDDNADNTAAAENLGIASLVFRSDREAALSLSSRDPSLPVASLTAEG